MNLPLSFFLTFLFIFSVKTSFYSSLPDALKCAIDQINGQSYILFIIGARAKGATYCSAHAAVETCVIIEANTVIQVSGDPSAVNGCIGKTIDQLKKQGRTFNLAKDMNVVDPTKPILKAQITQQTKVPKEPKDQKQFKEPKNKKQINVTGQIKDGKQTKEPKQTKQPKKNEVLLTTKQAKIQRQKKTGK